MPTRVAPVSVFAREDAPALLAAAGEGMQHMDLQARSAHRPKRFAAGCRSEGRVFSARCCMVTRLLASEVEDGLWELVAAGLVTADGFDNLRALIDPRRRRAGARIGVAARATSAGAGRCCGQTRRPVLCREPSKRKFLRRRLSQRYGVVFRDLLARESVVSSWRDLLVCYRRMESRGELRGGRFVAGFTGEQFALPDALEALRALKKRPETSAGDQNFSRRSVEPRRGDSTGASHRRRAVELRGVSGRHGGSYGDKPRND